MRTGIVGHAEALRVLCGQAMRMRLLMVVVVLLLVLGRLLHVGLLLRGHDRSLVGHAPEDRTEWGRSYATMQGKEAATMGDNAIMCVRACELLCHGGQCRERGGWETRAASRDTRREVGAPGITRCRSAALPPGCQSPRTLTPAISPLAF